MYICWKDIQQNKRKTCIENLRKWIIEELVLNAKIGPLALNVLTSQKETVTEALNLKIGQIFA